ncbi:ras and Rab interactor 3 [Sigmodon hispidus]
MSRQLGPTLLSPLESPEHPIREVSSEKPASGAPWEGLSPAPQPGMQHFHAQASTCPQSFPEFKGSLASLSDSLGVPASATDQDSYSTSIAKEELEFSSPNVKKPSMILDKARHRLSFVSFTSVLHAFLSNDRKLYKKVVELAQDKGSYFGSLVQDYNVALNSKSGWSPTFPAQLEAIVESALCKCVLKPLKDAINSSLLEIHSRDGSLQQLKENQLMILATTTTDLGATTSVPEVTVTEQILQKLTSMHKTYSPGKKISIFLKTCKLIYDSTALGNPGKPYGADDFLPVLMFLLDRSNLTEMLLNVEYMMELMDPAL